MKIDASFVFETSLLGTVGSWNFGTWDRTVCVLFSRLVSVRPGRIVATVSSMREGQSVVLESS